MVAILESERIGRECQLTVGCSAVLFDSQRRILLTRRRDNGRWCLPGGKMEPGESAAEACIREVHEETGLQVRIVRLIGVYTTPHRALAYSDGGRFQVVGLCFEAEPVGGRLDVSEETAEYGYFAPVELADLDLMEHHRERIADALTGQLPAFVR